MFIVKRKKLGFWSIQVNKSKKFLLNTISHFLFLKRKYKAFPIRCELDECDPAVSSTFPIKAFLLYTHQVCVCQHSVWRFGYVRKPTSRRTHAKFSIGSEQNRRRKNFCTIKESQQHLWMENFFNTEKSQNISLMRKQFNQIAIWLVFPFAFSEEVNINRFPYLFASNRVF